MPIAGPRTQFGPDNGYRNPGFEQPDRFNHWDRPGPVFWPGRSPGLMVVTLRGCTLAVGQIRRLWSQSVDLIGAQASYSWTANRNLGDSPDGVGITRAKRYMTRSVYVPGGTDNTRYAALHTIVRKENYHKFVTTGAGQVRGRPTIRNRLTSFGSRVPTLNQSVAAAADQSVGRGTQ